MEDSLRFFAFQFRFGWIGVIHELNVVLEVKFGTKTLEQLLALFSRKVPRSLRLTPFEKELTDSLTRYVNGEFVDFTQVRISLDSMTPFQSAVLEACRLIPYAETRSYQQVAELAGSTGAARAVGTVMKRNKFPLIVPCHRVCASHGLGGYSAGQGLDTKRELLGLEQGSLFQVF